MGLDVKTLALPASTMPLSTEVSSAKRIPSKFLRAWERSPKVTGRGTHFACSAPWIKTRFDQKGAAEVAVPNPLHVTRGSVPLMRMRTAPLPGSMCLLRVVLLQFFSQGADTGCGRTHSGSHAGVLRAFRPRNSPPAGHLRRCHVARLSRVAPRLAAA